MNKLHQTLISFLSVYAVCLTVILLSTVYRNTHHFKLNVLVPKHYINMTSQQTPVTSRRLNNGAVDSARNRSAVLLLTLFTSFKNDPSRRTIHRQTIRNWASFNDYDRRENVDDVTGSGRSTDGGLLNNVQPILYTTTATDEFNSSATFSAEENQIYATRLGWKVFPCPFVSSKNVPVLRSMFAHALSVSRSTFYAYANGDILFSRDLIETLRQLKIFATADRSANLLRVKHSRTSRILIIGSRKDCRVEDVIEGEVNAGNASTFLNDHAGITDGGKVRIDHDEADTRRFRGDSVREGSTDEHKGGVLDVNLVHDVKNTADVVKNNSSDDRETTYECNAGELFDKSKKATLRSAQDYFITTTTGVEHLKHIPDFVIGRAGYDNWLVARALIDDWMVIDASHTVTVRHQMSSTSLSRGHAAHFIQSGGDGLMNYAIAGKNFDYSLGLTDCARYETVIVQRNQTTKAASVKPILSKNIHLIALNEKSDTAENINSIFTISSNAEYTQNEQKIILQSLRAFDNIPAEFTTSGEDSKPQVSDSLIRISLLRSEQQQQLHNVSIRQETIILRDKQLSRYCKRAYLKNGLNPFLRRNLGIIR